MSTLYYIWPNGDQTYMKLIRRRASKLYPDGFTLLGSKFHPVGDFDSEDAKLPSEPLRIYKTKNGYRVFFINRFNPDLNSMFDELKAMGGDPFYSKCGKERGFYACRISPKSLVLTDRVAVTHLIRQTGEALPEWENFIQYHDVATNAFDLDAPLF